jgi:hypothetical protein
MSSWKQIAELINEHKVARPKMQAKDVYKLLYQGVFGVGHIMGPGTWNYLQNETKSIDLTDQPNDTLLESISIDGSIIRVNLRPFMREGYPLHRLIEAMRESDICGNPTSFLESWNSFAELVWSDQLDFIYAEVEAINNVLDKERPQPMHHSQQYRDNYHPAYRVVRRREILKILGV